jgi:hypothetical protein
MRDFIVTLWTGRAPLRHAFWDGAMIYGTLLNVLTTAAALGALAAGLSGLIALALHLLSLPYNIAAVVGVWRSAAAYRGPAHWAQLARVTVVIWAIVAVIL